MENTPQKNPEHSVKAPIFLNTPISSTEMDILGVEVPVDYLDRAIEAGAHMIAITSPFGSGKSSVVELLRKRRKKRHGDEEQFLSISMWSHLPGGQEKSGMTSADLHKTFVYQLASQIDPKKGSYINRRLSRNYGLLRLHASNSKYWGHTLIAVVCAVIWFLLRNYEDSLVASFPFLKNLVGPILTVAGIAAVLLGVFVLTHADVVFSSNKSEGARIIDEDEVMDIYRTEILGIGNTSKYKRYIVVIEDLDRTDSPEAVMQFLKELRKYYIPVSGNYAKEVTFIVNIKPEAILIPGRQETDELFFSKIFDYVLPLRTVNIDNYDAILSGLLKQHKETLQAMGFPVEDGTDLSQLSGMQWIIREEHLGLREIKDRLNIAFSLYDTLRERSDIDIESFEKCAAVAYLTTAFEEDFFSIDGRYFETLVDQYLQEMGGIPLEVEGEDLKDEMEEPSEDFIKAVKELIQAGAIDSTYRQYFYNYPKESHFYTTQEQAIRNAILRDEPFGNMEEIAQALVSKGSTVIEETYKKRLGLNLPLPIFVLENETFYLKAIQNNFDAVILLIKKMNYTSETIQRTLNIFRTMLFFDSERKVFNREHAEHLCDVWDGCINEKDLTELRQWICMNFPGEILWYQLLYSGGHNLITKQELEFLPLGTALQLINIKKISAETVASVVALFAEIQDKEQQKELSPQVEGFLRTVMNESDLDRLYIADSLIRFMSSDNRLIPDLENVVCAYLEPQEGNEDEEDDDEDEDETDDEAKAEREKQKNLVFREYQAFVNELAPGGLTEDTARHISTIDCHEGYVPEVAQNLLSFGFIIDYVLVSLCDDLTIPYKDQKIQQSIEKHATWLSKEHPKLFLRLRFDIIHNQAESLAAYTFLFGVQFPAIKMEELEELSNVHGVSETQVMELALPERITSKEAEVLRDYFCRRKQPYKNVVAIFEYVARMDEVIAKDFFYSLNFGNIQYYNLPPKQKALAKESINDILELSEAENKLKFMNAVGWLDPEWEAELAPELSGAKSDLQQQYVNVVNNIGVPSRKTLEVIGLMSTYYGMCPGISEELFKQKQYFRYAVAKILWDKRFEMEPGDKGEVLWDTYIKIFSKDRDTTWDGVKRYMRNNHDFLNRIMDTGAFKTFEEESRMQLADINQSKESIIEAASAERGVDFTLEYYLAIHGFRDKAAASEFVHIVCDTPKLLASDQLYDHAREKLVDSALKGLYTRKRNEQKVHST